MLLTIHIFTCYYLTSLVVCLSVWVKSRNRFLTYFCWTDSPQMLHESLLSMTVPYSSVFRTVSHQGKAPEFFTKVENITVKQEWYQNCSLKSYVQIGVCWENCGINMYITTKNTEAYLFLSLLKIKIYLFIWKSNKNILWFITNWNDGFISCWRHKVKTTLKQDLVANNIFKVNGCISCLFAG